MAAPDPSDGRPGQEGYQNQTLDHGAGILPLTFPKVRAETDYPFLSLLNLSTGLFSHVRRKSVLDHSSTLASRAHPQVQPADIESFLASYSTLLRSSFSGGLRPKKKKGDLARQRALKAAKRQATKATAKGAAVDPATAAVLAGSAGVAAGGGGAAHFAPRLPKVVGPRRGNGVQKRRRLIKRREKAVERFKATRTRASAD